MSQLATTNVRVDVYRGFNAAGPYSPPHRPAAAQGVAGLLRPHVRNGRFGFNAVALHWTNVLLLPAGTDVRSAYDSQLNSFNAANADTVVVADYPAPGRCTAFVVVMVQRGGRGTDADLLTCYLDRCLPQDMPCPDPTVLGVDGCPGVGYPLRVHASLGTNPCLSGSLPLDWNGSRWTGTGPWGTGNTITLGFYGLAGGTGASDFRLETSFGDNCQAVTTYTPLFAVCDPLQVIFGLNAGGGACNCNDAGDWTVTT